MNFPFRARHALVLAAVVASFAVHAAQGRLGFSVSVETDGLFSKTLKQVKITAVTPGSPAEQAGLQPGDDVQAIDDMAIAGADGSRVMDKVHAVQPGDHLRLKVLRGGEARAIDIVGGAPR